MKLLDLIKDNLRAKDKKLPRI